MAIIATFAGDGPKMWPDLNELAHVVSIGLSVVNSGQHAVEHRRKTSK
jgi:hypothetical protein